MASAEDLIIRKHNTLEQPHLYLQQDHQEFLIAPRGVTANVFLQLAAKFCRKEEKRRLLTARAVAVTNGCNRPKWAVLRYAGGTLTGEI